MKLENIKWPVYVLHSDEVEERDGLLFCDTQIVDDKNMSGNTLGQRRLQSPHKNLYKLKVMIEGFRDFVHHKGLNYIDSNGKFKKAETLTDTQTIKKLQALEKSIINQSLKYKKEQTLRP